MYSYEQQNDTVSRWLETELWLWCLPQKWSHSSLCRTPTLYLFPSLYHSLHCTVTVTRREMRERQKICILFSARESDEWEKRMVIGIFRAWNVSELPSLWTDCHPCFDTHHERPTENYSMNEKKYQNCNSEITNPWAEEALHCPFWSLRDSLEDGQSRLSSLSCASIVDTEPRWEWRERGKQGGSLPDWTGNTRNFLFRTSKHSKNCFFQKSSVEIIRELSSLDMHLRHTVMVINEVLSRGAASVITW